jgi:hypothetical protein
VAITTRTTGAEALAAAADGDAAGAEKAEAAAAADRDAVGAGEAGAAEVLNTGNDLGFVELKAALDEHLLGEWVANLNGWAS